LPAPPRAEVIDRQVVRDPEEPGRERRRPPAELADRLEHLQERLRGQVLGVVPVPDRHVQIAVDAIEVLEVQLLERVTVALLRTGNELFDGLSLDHGGSHYLRSMPVRTTRVTRRGW